MSSPGGVKSADRALDVIELLARARRPLPTMLVARRCDMPKSSTHRLLNLLRDRGWATYHPDARGWTLGPAAERLGCPEDPHERLRRLAGPPLDELAQATGLTAQLAVRDHDEVLFLDRRTPGGSDPGLVSAPGVRVPALRTAAGRALLMHLAAPHRPSPPNADSPTVTGVVRELADAHARGLAVVVGGLTPGVRCLAAAVPGRAGTPIAAVTLSLPADASTGGLESLLRRAAQHVSDALALVSARSCPAA